jgi:hypothetical protein
MILEQISLWVFSLVLSACFHMETEKPPVLYCISDLVSVTCRLDSLDCMEITVRNRGEEVILFDTINFVIMRLSDGDDFRFLVISNDEDDIGYYPKQGKRAVLYPSDSLTLRRVHQEGGIIHFGFHFQYITMHRAINRFDEIVGDSVLNIKDWGRLRGYNFE